MLYAHFWKQRYGGPIKFFILYSVLQFSFSSWLFFFQMFSFIYFFLFWFIFQKKKKKEKKEERLDKTAFLFPLFSDWSTVVFVQALHLYSL